VREGNAAAGQLQLDAYGDLLEAARLYAAAGRHVDADVANRLAESADFVGRIWQQPDSGLWEVRSPPEHFTQSKMMCWVALDRAVRLAEQGHLPDRHVADWRAQARAVRAFVDEHCWSPTKGSYVRAAGTEELDAGLLLGVLSGYGDGDRDPDDPRMAGTVDAVRRELGSGPFVRRYLADDGLAGEEGAFLPCSFWLAEALARVGRHDEAAALFEELLGMANDVGLYAEEVDPATGELLGNLPQALTHFALVSAATALREPSR
jgi:GH15 family glucan-1,4-alpha-glucosidase